MSKSKSSLSTTRTERSELLDSSSLRLGTAKIPQKSRPNGSTEMNIKLNEPKMPQRELGDSGITAPGTMEMTSNGTSASGMPFKHSKKTRESFMKKKKGPAPIKTGVSFKKVPSQIFTCEVCDKGFEKNENLQRHKKCHQMVTLNIKSLKEAAKMHKIIVLGGQDVHLYPRVKLDVLNLPEDSCHRIIVSDSEGSDTRAPDSSAAMSAYTSQTSATNLKTLPAPIAVPERLTQPRSDPNEDCLTVGAVTHGIKATETESSKEHTRKREIHVVSLHKLKEHVSSGKHVKEQMRKLAKETNEIFLRASNKFSPEAHKKMRDDAHMKGIVLPSEAPLRGMAKYFHNRFEVLRKQGWCL